MNKKILLILISTILISNLVLAITTINKQVIYPGDTIKLTIRPNRRAGFYNIISVMKDEQVVDLITVQCPTICRIRRTVYYTIPQDFLGEYYFATFDYAINDYELDPFAVIEQGGAPTGEFKELIIKNIDTPFNLLVYPKQGKNADITISTLLRVKDCQNYNVFAYLCDLNQLSTCTIDEYTHKIQLPLVNQVRRKCWFNYTGEDYFPFYYQAGDWQVFVKSGIVEKTENFTYSNLVAINYPSFINFGSLNARMWNIGVPQSGQDLTNYGNLPMKVHWNSTSFNCVSEACTDSWLTYYQTTDEYTFQIDDDNLFLQEIETGLEPVFITNFTADYFPQNDLAVCISPTCNDNLGEKIKTFFHLKIPDIGKGIYQGEIKITIHPPLT